MTIPTCPHCGSRASALMDGRTTPHFQCLEGRGECGILFTLVDKRRATFAPGERTRLERIALENKELRESLGDWFGTNAANSQAELDRDFLLKILNKFLDPPLDLA